MQNARDARAGQGSTIVADGCTAAKLRCDTDDTAAMRGGSEGSLRTLIFAGRDVCEFAAECAQGRELPGDQFARAADATRPTPASCPT